MTEPPPSAPPPADDPATLYGEDAASGRRFLRWNAAALVVGLILLALGATQLERRERPQQPADVSPAPAGSNE